MTDTDPLALDGLGLAGLDHLRSHFGTISSLPHHPTAADWGSAWWRRILAEVDRRMAAPGWSDVDPPDVATLGTGELMVIADRFAAVAAHCELAGVAEWSRRLVCTLHEELALRTTPAEWERARDKAMFQMIAAEERARDREGRLPPDTTGLPTWREISGE